MRGQESATEDGNAAAAASDPLVVHVTADFPDAMAPGKTAVVRRLVEATGGFRHKVYSLNRMSGLAGVVSMPSGSDVTALAYRAPPRGLLLRTGVLAAARAIAEDVERRRLRPALLHAHKLTVEGLAVEWLARRLGAPYAVTIQGDTDLKIIAVRRDLRNRYRAILEGAAFVTTLAPWSRDALSRALGFPESSIVLLPCLTERDDMGSCGPAGSARFAAVFHLASARRKNLHGLAAAATIAAQERPELSIDVIGGGPPADVFTAQAMIDRAGARGSLRLRGPMTGAELRQNLPKYAGLVLPTLRESYGLVHVEALFAGLPILWSKDRGVDGLFPADVGWRCDPTRPEDIAAGLLDMAKREASLKATVERRQLDGSLDHLRRKPIVEGYKRLLRAALGG